MPAFVIFLRNNINLKYLKILKNKNYNFLDLSSRDTIPRVWDIINSSFSYLIYAATYFHTLVIFAFCNVDNVTWGTKGVNASE